MFYIHWTPDFGRGVYAKRAIKKGEIVHIADVLVLNQFDTPIANMTDLQYYTFVYDTNRDCLVMGIGELFNHADQPNVAYILEKSDRCPKMYFEATRDIEPHEQLFIDYSADTKVETKNYVGKNLI